jgi:hypothetical protein
MNVNLLPCIRCGSIAEDRAWACCLNCRLALAEADRNKWQATGATHRDTIARRLLAEVSFS